MIRLKFCHRRVFLLVLNWYRLVVLDSYIRIELPTKHLSIIPANSFRIPLGIQGDQKNMKSRFKEQLENLVCSPLIITLAGPRVLNVAKPTHRQRSSTTRFQHDKFGGSFFPRHRRIRQDVVARLVPSMSLIWTHQIGFPRSAALALKAWHVRSCPPWKLSRLEAVRMVKTLLRYLRKDSQRNY